MRRFAFVCGSYVLASLLVGRTAHGADPAERPLPEPLFTETVTDLDGEEAGEAEAELNASVVRARRGGGVVSTESVEVEWLVTRRLGLRLEPFRSSSDPSGAAPSTSTYGANGALSWKLVRDPDRAFYAQAELSGRLPWDASSVLSPGDSTLPVSLDLRAGTRFDRVTLRGGVGAEAGGGSAHAPLRGSLALLTGFLRDERFGFAGIEVDADGARRNPLVVALDVVADCTPLGVPFGLGVALPWGVGTRAEEPSYGVLVRLFFVSAREAAAGHHDR